MHVHLSEIYLHLWCHHLKPREDLSLESFYSTSFIKQYHPFLFDFINYFLVTSWKTFVRMMLLDNKSIYIAHATKTMCINNNDKQNH